MLDATYAIRKSYGGRIPPSLSCFTLTACGRPKHAQFFFREYPDTGSHIQRLMATSALL